MRAYDICIEQEIPEIIQERVTIIAQDIMEAMVSAHGLIEDLKDIYPATGGKAIDITNLRLAAIDEQGLVMNDLSTHSKWDAGQLTTLALVIKAQID